MSEPKFTKGGWKVELTKFGNIEGANVYYEHGFLTSSNVIEVDESRLEGEPWLAMRDRTSKQRKLNEFESIANMHLIATAPKMYALLEKCKEVLLSTYDATEWPANGETKCDIVAGEIDKLLQKARGEQQ